MRIKNYCQAVLLQSLFMIVLSVPTWAAPDSGKMDLSGIWRFQLDPIGFGKTDGSELYLSRLAETIVLPGSTDESGKGIQNNAKYVDRLSRKYEYQGAAWYQREVVIPQAWNGKQITLNLERCHWDTAVYVDGKKAGTDERLSTPDVFDLTSFLAPGIHTLTICIDNSMKYPMDNWTHALTEYTQTNWNGIVGDISLNAREKVNVAKVNVYPDSNLKQVKVKVDISGLASDQTAIVELKASEKGGKEVADFRAQTDSVSESKGLEFILPMGKDVKVWDEFTPSLYEMKASVTTDGHTDSKTITFGMRTVSQGSHHIQLNGHDIHLRGTLECAVFPLTGYPSTDISEWKRIFLTIKDYGMNHVRFHSWCPPEAAFEAADEVGIYLQVELPMWFHDAGQYPDRRAFFEKEMYSVLDNYGNHPSFILMCNGNELGGDFAVLESFVKDAQAYDNRHLYSASTARKHVASDQFYTSHVTDKGWITVYEGKPSTDWDNNATSDIDVPVIAHEAGQRCMYPNFDEISKYNGVLEARNMEVFRERLTKNGMLHQADDFFRATGAHTVLQYKAVFEALLRTDKSGGFQLLGLSDFPGQGTALVGVLDAFWDSKGLVTPEKFRESCAPVVLLARIPKRTYSPGESFNAKMFLYNYSPNSVKGEKMKWTIEDESGNTLVQGMDKIKEAKTYAVDSLCEISTIIPQVGSACKLTLKATFGSVKNEWDIWIYPQVKNDIPDGDFVLSRSWSDARKYLEEGRKVLLVPENCPGRKTTFEGHFWNPIMFKWDPLIVGTLIDSSHPAFKDFPTSYYADWQWWDILNNSTALELRDFAEVTPIIQSIDSYETNYKLGIAFETKVGNGSLFVLGIDIDKDMEQRPATAQLLRSVKEYVASDGFAPAVELPFYRLDALFGNAVSSKIITNDDAVRFLLNK